MPGGIQAPAGRNEAGPTPDPLGAPTEQARLLVLGCGVAPDIDLEALRGFVARLQALLPGVVLAVVADRRHAGHPGPQPPTSGAAVPAQGGRFSERPAGQHWDEAFDDAALDAALRRCAADWLLAWAPHDGSDAAAVARGLALAGAAAGPEHLAWACGAGAPACQVGELAVSAGPAAGVLLRRSAVVEVGLKPDPQLPGWAAANLLYWRVLLARPQGWWAGADLTTAAPYATIDGRWADARACDAVLDQGYGRLLGEASAAHGRGPAPTWLQAALVEQLAAYLDTDRRERSPLRGVVGARAERLREHLGRLLQSIDPALIDQWRATRPVDETRELMQAFCGRKGYGPVRRDARFGALVRLRWYVHGAQPAEAFFADDRPIRPLAAKWRACRAFGRSMLQERLVWLAVPAGASLVVELDGHRQALVEPTACAVRPARWRDRLRRAVMRGLAAWPGVRRRYRNAWVFADRHGDADDNAEHLYRWVRAHHPEVNAWFLLDRASPDWPRLAAEGFRLVPPGLRRRLLLFNAEQLLSSHAELTDGGMSRAVYGSLMRWRYTFLQHGVTHHDISHWLSPLPLDRVICASPAEQAAFVEDGGPYAFTRLEARLTGFPRHDRLIEIARHVPPAERRLLLVMPTWRGSLLDGRAAGAVAADPVAAAAASEYCMRWGEFLRDPGLHALARRHDLELVFLPHPSAVPFLAAFGLPPEVAVATKASQPSMQPLFARTRAFVTDYTSAAFDLALLRRQVFYYQFDRERFYSSDHNWRPGRFDVERDGFGPVLTSQPALLAALEDFLASGVQAWPRYLARMKHALPLDDGQACRRCFDSVPGGRRRRVAAARLEPPGGRQAPT